jgi:UDP-arabinose 4-epimerase
MSRETPVLVTGGAGYVGAHACKALALSGYLPISYDNLVYGHRDAVQWGPLEIGDTGDRERLDKVFRSYEPKAVLHFAAFAYVGESVGDPARYYRNNVANTLNLLEVMRDHGCRNIVFSSTCAVYGEPETLPLTESHTPRPVNPYGASKLMVERMLGDFGAAYSMRYVALRYFNAAGADPDGQIGERHDPEPHLIPSLIGAALGQRDPLLIYGTDYDTADGTAVRDYVHVSDLASAHSRALAYLETGADSVTLNLGTGLGHSVQQIVAAVERVSGLSVPVVAAPRRSGDPAVLVADATLAAHVLDWFPERTDIDTIVGSAWHWHLASAETRGGFRERLSTPGTSPGCVARA